MIQRREVPARDRVLNARDCGADFPLLTIAENQQPAAEPRNAITARKPEIRKPRDWFLLAVNALTPSLGYLELILPIEQNIHCALRIGSADPIN
jgi:hypothetical protein